MSRFFLDSSALVKRYIVEEGTPRVVQLVEGGERLVVSRLGLVEVASAAVRRANAGDVSEDGLRRVLVALDNEFRTLFDVIELDRATIARSVDLVRLHALRAADALQLASALMAAQGPLPTHTLVFVSADDELNTAAEKEGLTVLDPSQM